MTYANEPAAYRFFLLHTTTGEIIGGNEYAADARDARKDQIDPSTVTVIKRKDASPAALAAFYARNA